MVAASELVEERDEARGGEGLAWSMDAPKVSLGCKCATKRT